MNFWRKNKKIYRLAIFAFMFAISFVIFSQIAIAADNLTDTLTKDSNAFTAGTCAGWTGIDIGACILTAISWILSWIQWVFLFVLQVAVWFFEFSVGQSINSLATYMSDSGGVVMVWKLLRDITNMLFLMVMVYIAIGTVLQLEGVNWKKQIGAIIMAAVLINFSMAITKVVVDISNVFAVYFYEQASGGPNGPGIPRLLFDAVNIDQIVAHKTQTGAISQVPSLLSMVVQTMASIILILATSYVLFLAGFLFIVRLITIIFSLILSPLPWIGMAVPKYGGKISGSYWETLINQAFFAPVYMFCLYFVMKFITCIDVNAIAGSTGGGYLLAGALPSLMFYVVAISLMFSTVVAAKKMGAEGMSFAQSGAKWATGSLAAVAGGVVGYGFKGAYGAGGAGVSKIDEKLGVSRTAAGLYTDFKGTAAYKAAGDTFDKAKKLDKDILGGYIGSGVGAVKEKITTNAGLAYEAGKTMAKSPLETVSGFVGEKAGVSFMPGEKERKEAEKIKKYTD